MKQVTASILFLALFALTIGACKKDTAPTGTLLFHMHTNIDTNEVDAGVVSVDADGRHFQLDKAQFIVSGIELKKEDGTYLSVDNVFVLKTIDEESYTIGSVPAGNYLSVRFKVGVDATNNAKAPSAFSSGPLADTDNWFGATSKGFIFVDVEGKADVSAGQTGPVDQAFSYQLGTDAMLETVTLPDQGFTVAANTENLVHLTCDYGQLLKGVDFKSQPTGSPDANAAVAQQIANNVPNFIRYEE